MNAYLSLLIPCVYISTVPFDYIRLVDGDSVMEGRVEIYHAGQWGSVCDDGWDINDAMVVCRQLGYAQAIGAPAFAVFGEADPSSQVRSHLVNLPIYKPQHTVVFVQIQLL